MAECKAPGCTVVPDCKHWHCRSCLRYKSGGTRAMSDFVWACWNCDRPRAEVEWRAGMPEQQAQPSWPQCPLCNADIQYVWEDDPVIRYLIHRQAQCCRSGCGWIGNVEHVARAKVDISLKPQELPVTITEPHLQHPAIDRAFRFLCGLDLHDQPISVQREQREVVQNLMKALKGDSK